MDELTLLRSMAKDAADPSAETLEKGRRSLIEHIGSRPTTARRRSLKRAAWAGGGTILAGALVATLVFTNVLGLAGWRGGADAAAAAALSDAAAATIKTSDPVVGTGQYLKVETEAVYLTSINSAEGEYLSYLATQNGQMYIPADYNDDWVWVREPSTAVKLFGADPEKVAAAANSYPGILEVIRAPQGRFYNGPSWDWGLDELSRDPQQLLNQIYQMTAGSSNPDDAALDFIRDTLHTGVAPAELRAALYLAAAGIPGITIIDDAATLNGRTGIAFSRGEGEEFIIDPETGLMIGERSVMLQGAAQMSIPAGEVVGWTSVTTSVVDSAPEGGTICGNRGEPSDGAGSECKGK